MKKTFLLYVIVLLVTLSPTGCYKRKSLDMLSPKDIVDLYYQAKDNGDTAILQKIIYLPPDISEVQKKAKTATTGSEEKTIKKMTGAKIKTEYEKILDDDTAEVGVVMYAGTLGLKKRIPFQQLILKKEDNIWKFFQSKHELTENQLIFQIKENPYDASAIYHLGRKYQPLSQVRANKYFRKYIELEPDGFWISDSLLDQLERYENIEERVQELLGRLYNIPKQSPDRASVYWTIGQLYMEQGEYEKTKAYFLKADEILKTQSKRSLYTQDFNKVKKEFELELKGQTSDILTKLEAEGAYE